MNSFCLIFVAVAVLYWLYRVFQFFKQFSTPCCENLISGEILGGSLWVKGKQIYSSFPQLKSVALVPVPSHVSVLRPYVPSSSLKVVEEMHFFFFLNEAIWDVPHGDTSWLRWQKAVPLGVAIHSSAILCPSLSYWIFLFCWGLLELTFLTFLTFLARKVRLPFGAYSAKARTTGERKTKLTTVPWRAGQRHWLLRTHPGPECLL